MTSEIKKQVNELLKTAEHYIFEAEYLLPLISPMSTDRETGELKINANTEEAADARFRLALYNMRIKLAQLEYQLKER